MGYYCKECGLAVIVIPKQEPIRACKCNGVIIADAASIVKIISDIPNKNNVRLQPNK